MDTGSFSIEVCLRRNLYIRDWRLRIPRLVVQVTIILTREKFMIVQCPDICPSYLCNVERGEAELRKSRVKRRDKRLLLLLLLLIRGGSLEGGDALIGERSDRSSRRTWRRDRRIKFVKLLQWGATAHLICKSWPIMTIVTVISIVTIIIMKIYRAAILTPKLSHLLATVLHQRLVLRHSQLFTWESEWAWRREKRQAQLCEGFHCDMVRAS